MLHIPSLIVEFIRTQLIYRVLLPKGIIIFIVLLHIAFSTRTKCDLSTGRLLKINALKNLQMA